MHLVNHSATKMIVYNKLSLLSFVVALFIPINGQDCVWNKETDFPSSNPPLIVDNADGHIVLPVLEEGERIVRVPAGTTLTIACSEYSLDSFGVPAVTAVCVQDLVLDVDGTIDVCFDATLETTLWTEHVLHGHSISAKEIDPSRPSFKSSTGFFTVPMSTVYSQKSQLQLMIDVLGDEDLANTIIDTHKEWYFAKGHMSPDADFVTEAEQDATYYFINALPQWQAFNNGNWKHMEERTRTLAEDHGTDMRIISGGFNILNLDDINANPVEIFLGETAGEMVVPAPALTWKVVFEESSNKAAALVGINNPHIDMAPETLCTDICDQLLWIDFDIEDLAHGYTYCCTVEDLRAVIPDVPDIGSVDLLDQ
ncbi:unnamed protein product [Meganyctiphanes norvegica]|uniref:DNA/RNA non-specific endonuclease/pyrophosphatase/phosphodiesterase domain-containing protein n=1 Tax=Meganyctiphanes norvegica TaxID=48144 RepID=A0AAV2R6A7_MEGNR